jgi:hypothetical protein
MGTNMSDTNPCDAISNDLAQLALGTLSGRERADVLDHLERCPECAADLESLSVAADALLLLAPEATPPVGFDRRVVASMTQGRERRHSISQRIVALAAVALVALGIGVGALVTRSPGHDPSFASALLSSPSGAKGDVMLSRGPGTWMFVTLDDVKASGPITCAVTLRSGKRETVGHFPISSGYGAWAVWLPMPATEVKSVTVMDTAGVTLAEAPINV